MGRLDGGGLYRRVTPGVVALLALGVGGFGLVVLSGQGSGPFLSGGILSQSAGVCLASACQPLSAASTPTASALGRLLAVEHGAADDLHGGASVDLSFCYVLLCSSLAQAVSSLLHSPVVAGRGVPLGRRYVLGVGGAQPGLRGPWCSPLRGC